MTICHNRLIQETDALGQSQYYVYDSAGDLTRYTDGDGQVRTCQYDSHDRVSTETWYVSAADADAQQNPEDTIQYTYDSAGRLLSESDDSSSISYTYDSAGRVVTTTETSADGPTVVLTSQYNYASSERSGLAASIDGTADFRNLYHYNSGGQVDHVTQAGQLGGNAVAEKEGELDYAGGQLQALRRTQDGQSVADSEFTYDSLGRLTGLTHYQGDTTLASYTFAYSSGSGVLPESGASGSAVSSPLSPVNPGQSMLPVHDTRGIVDSLLSAVSSGQDLLTAVTSVDGTVNYSYDPTGQLTGATYSAANGSASAVLPNESYAYDANGNPTGSGHVVVRTTG